jgi:hypothetical protein
MANVATSSCYIDGQLLHTIGEPKIGKISGGEVTPQFGMSPTREAWGFRTGLKPSYRITFPVPVTEGEQEYDWIEAADEHREVTFVVENGSSIAAFICMVESAEEDIKADTTNDVTISLVARVKRHY